MAKENVKENTGHVDEDYSREAVPAGARRGFWAMFVIMLGFTFFSASMSVGAKLGNGLDLSGFVWSVLLGGVILGAYTGGLGYIASDTGLSLDLLAQRSFGTVGSKLPSALIALTQIGWFGVGVAMFAIPAAEVLKVNPIILVVIAGACMTGSAYFGIKALTVVSAVSVPLIAVLGIYSMVTATIEGGGLVSIFAQSTGGLSVFAGVGLVIGSFISGGTATPNFARFAKSNKIAVITTVVAFFLGNTLMFAFGAVGGAFTGKDDIFYVMIAQGLAIPALLVLGANIWLYNNFVGWLNFLNATLPPVGAIVMLNYVLHRADYRAGAEPRLAVHWGSILGVVLGALAGNFVPFGIASVNAMLVAAVCHLAAEKLVYAKK